MTERKKNNPDTVASSNVKIILSAMQPENQMGIGLIQRWENDVNNFVLQEKKVISLIESKPEIANEALSNLDNQKALEILDETKKAVQMNVVDHPLNNGFVHGVQIDGELYIVRIEKYVPAAQFIEQHIHLLTES